MHLAHDSITNDFSVELCLAGANLDPDRISSILGMDPTSKAIAGTPRNGSGGSLHDLGHWAHEVSSSDEVNECRDHRLSCLADAVMPHREELRAAGAERIYFYFTLSSMVGLLNIRFKAETLQKLSSLDADLYVSCFDCFNPKHPIWQATPSLANVPADGATS